jgi:hypothetical protein
LWHQLWHQPQRPLSREAYEPWRNYPTVVMVAATPDAALAVTTLSQEVVTELAAARGSLYWQTERHLLGVGHNGPRGVTPLALFDATDPEHRAALSDLVARGMLCFGAAEGVRERPDGATDHDGRRLCVEIAAQDRAMIREVLAAGAS